MTIGSFEPNQPFDFYKPEEKKAEEPLEVKGSPPSNKPEEKKEEKKEIQEETPVVLEGNHEDPHFQEIYKNELEEREEFEEESIEVSQEERQLRIKLKAIEEEELKGRTYQA
jgi:hypothetical protein